MATYVLPWQPTTSWVSETLWYKCLYWGHLLKVKSLGMLQRYSPAAFTLVKEMIHQIKIYFPGNLYLSTMCPGGSHHQLKREIPSWKITGWCLTALTCSYDTMILISFLRCFQMEEDKSCKLLCGSIPFLFRNVHSGFLIFLLFCKIPPEFGAVFVCNVLENIWCSLFILEISLAGRNKVGLSACWVSHLWAKHFMDVNVETI